MKAKVMNISNRILKHKVTRNQKSNMRELPWISVRDLEALVGLIGMAPLSWIIPERLWGISSLVIAFFAACVHARGIGLQTKRIMCTWGLNLQVPSLWITAVKLLAGSIEENFQYLRECCPGGWRPRIDLVGREHIEHALQRGHGAILWVGPFLYRDLVLKKGLHQAGFPVTHLGSYWHGPSSSRFGVRFVQPIKVEIERRYLAERIVIPRDGKLGYIRRVERRIRENGLVSITCEGHLDQKVIRCPVLNGTMELATGAASFALSTEAALLPVFTIRKHPGEFEIIVEKEFEVPVSRSRHQAIELLVHRYAKLLESFMIRYPVSFPLHR